MGFARLVPRSGNLPAKSSFLDLGKKSEKERQKESGAKAKSSFPRSGDLGQLEANFRQSLSNALRALTEREGLHAGWEW